MDIYTHYRYKDIADNSWFERLNTLHNEFVFGDYNWVFVSKEDHSTTFDLIYECTPIDKEDIQMDIFQMFKSKLSNYRQHLEAQLSLFYDYTVLNITVTIIESMKFKVCMTCVNGTDIFDKARTIYRRPSEPAAFPLLETNSNFEGTAFPLTECKQFSNPRSYEKGYLLLNFGIDPEGELTSDHYSPSSYDHGVPIISLMLTKNEYKNFSKHTDEYEGYEMVTDLNELVSTFGCGNEYVGKIILWIGLLVDTIGNIEHWTFNHAHDRDACTITTIRKLSIWRKMDTDEFTIESESMVSGIMSEGVEAVIVQDPKNSGNNTIQYTISFCNGIEDIKKHASNVKDIVHHIFDNLYNDTSSFGWKLGGHFGNRYTGLLCVSDDVKYTEVRDTSYVRIVKAQVEYHTYYFCPDKKLARRLSFNQRYKDAFGNNFQLSQLMYPIKISNNINLFKSYGKNASKKYNYVALVSTKDYQNGASDLINFLKGLLEADSYTINILANASFENPITDGFCYDLIEEFVSPYIILNDKNTCYTVIGKRLLVLEKIPFEP